MLSTSFRLSLAALAFGLCTAAQSAALVTNNPDQVSGDNMSFALEADNFHLGGTGATYDISAIRFWSLQSAAADYRGSVYWAIYSDLSGAPNSVLFSGNAAVAATATGGTGGPGYAEYVFDITGLSFQLSDGDYWLALQNGALGTSDATEMLWESSATGEAGFGVYADFSNGPNPGWTSTDNQHAFVITGSRVIEPPPGDVPAPNTLALLFAGVLAAGALRRKV